MTTYERTLFKQNDIRAWVLVGVSRCEFGRTAGTAVEIEPCRVGVAEEDFVGIRFWRRKRDSECHS